jgi:asparagine synthase (glutamine-hydrolysing)
MSGIFAVFNRDGALVTDDILTAMLESISYWQPDDRGTWYQAGIALGHSMLWNTPESKQDHLPREQGNLVLTMDARLDNREELVQQLEVLSGPVEQITESEFILAAYEHWGEACPRYLLGDFVFVIWDVTKQKLFCARDHVGVKQLYFHLTDRLFVCGNDLKGVLEHPAIQRQIRPESVANYIVNHQLLSRKRTFFRAIEKLAPGHSLTVTATGVERTCYWRAEDVPRVKHTDFDACVVQLRALLERAVADRTRSGYPIASHLSGGLDSSALAVLAARRLRKKGERLLAFNWLHEPEGEDGNHAEWTNSRKIADAESIEHHYVSLDGQALYRYMRECEPAFGNSAFFWYEYPVRAAARERGVRTILSGWGGDELSTYHGQSYYSDLFTRGKILKALQELRQVVRRGKNKSVRAMIRVLYHSVFMNYIPRRWYCFMPKNRCLPEPSLQFVKKSFLPTVQSELRRDTPLTMQPQPTIRAHMEAYWQQGHLQSRIESWAAAAFPDRLEYSYPLLDKRIIEFVLGLDPEFFVQAGTGRFIFRKALAGSLPEDILWGSAKEEPNRVQRLASLVIAAGKQFVQVKKRQAGQSRWIDERKLLEEAESIQNISMDWKSVSMLMELETSLVILLSHELNHNV